MTKKPQAKLSLLTPVPVTLTERDIADALYQVILQRTEVDDDAGCDWKTSKDGKRVYIGGRDWEVSGDPRTAALVDAMNIMRHTIPMKVSMPCADCDGHGFYDDQKCRMCDGTGDQKEFE